MAKTHDARRRMTGGADRTRAAVTPRSVRPRHPSDAAADRGVRKGAAAPVRMAPAAGRVAPAEYRRADRALAARQPVGETRRQCSSLLPRERCS